MAKTKIKDLEKLSEKDLEKKMKELKFELIKSQAGQGKTSKKKEIRRIIARIKTLNARKSNDGEALSK